MLSVSYAGKNAYSAGKTSGVLRGGASGANICYVFAHCAPWVLGLKKLPITKKLLEKPRGSCSIQELPVLIRKVVGGTKKSEYGYLTR